MSPTLATSSFRLDDNPAASPRPRVVVAGQMPPPIGGQTLNIKRIHDLLAASDRVNVAHWDFQFSREINAYRRFSWNKVAELGKAVFRLAMLRAAGPIDWILYPAGGPHKMPVLRDIFLLPFACVFGRRVAVHFQAAGFADRAQSLPGWMVKPLRLVVGNTYASVVLTNFGKRDAEAAGSSRAVVIPNAVEDFNPSGGLPDQENAAPVFLNVGHLCPDKGTDALLEAFSRVKEAIPGARLRLVGECLAPFTPATLMEEIHRLGLEQSVEWCGLKQGNELTQQFRTSSVFVFPSVAPYESFGLVLAEAMMWGLPLVVSNWRANAEVVGSPCGGIIYEPGSNHAESLAAALIDCAGRQALWPGWSLTNRQRYEQWYAIPAFQEKWLAFFCDEPPKSQS